jgi:hypothetical protein
MERDHQSKLPIRVFLSHRYKAPTVNEYFFSLFQDEAEIQFEVDIGTIATNVTRLERMVRDADAFVGIYSYTDESLASPMRSDLLKASRYFRLELDLAIRAKKPSLVFVDQRYRNVLDTPPSILRCPFDHREILNDTGKPSEQTFRRHIQRFQNIVAASKKYHAERDREVSTAGVLLPQASDVEEAYSIEHFDLIESLVREQGSVDVIRLPWPSEGPPVLDSKFYGAIEKLDWLCIDLGERASKAGVVPFLHGQFVPMVRLLYEKQAPPNQHLSEIEATLFGAYEVGYRKDVVRWSDEASLSSGLGDRISTLYTQRRLISDLSKANEYFRSAALRKEPVFVSYSGEDQETAASLRRALKKRFQAVFDYRDKGESIRPGEPWLEEIFDRLSKSAIGIMLLSAPYLASGNCLHEAREMVALRDSKKMQLVPIRIQQDKLEVPPWLEDLQYLRPGDYNGDYDAIVEFLITLIDHKRP